MRVKAITIRDWEADVSLAPTVERPSGVYPYWSPHLDETLSPRPANLLPVEVADCHTNPRLPATIVTRETTRQLLDSGWQLSAFLYGEYGIPVDMPLKVVFVDCWVYVWLKDPWLGDTHGTLLVRKHLNRTVDELVAKYGPYWRAEDTNHKVLYRGVYVKETETGWS